MGSLGADHMRGIAEVFRCIAGKDAPVLQGAWHMHRNLQKNSSTAN